MIVTHAKVSGIANPADPDLVGGEDWDDPHVVTGPVLVGVAVLRIGGEGGGGILSQIAAGFASTFTKTDTGTYRVEYLPSDYGSATPAVVVMVSRDSGSPRFVRWTLENDGDDFIKIVTIDDTGAAVNVTNANLTVLTASTSA